MNRAIFKMSALAILLGTSYFSNAATVTGTGGTVNFTGSVTETACSVDVNSTNQDIDLGQVRLTDMATAGAMSPKTSFHVQLDDCDPAVSTAASFGFLGQADSDDTTSLANLDSGAGAAAKVGVQLTDTAGSIVPLDGTYDATSKITLVDGTNTADFAAYMIATATGATAGSVHSTVNFTVQYE